MGGLLHERVVLRAWKRFFNWLTLRLRPDMQTALMSTSEPYSKLVSRNITWLALLQFAKAAVGMSQIVALRDIKVFAYLSESESVRWASAFSVQERLANDIILRQSSLARSFYAIRAGSCAVFHNGAEVCRLGPGDHFGGVALMLGVPSSTSLVAMTDTTLLEMPGDVFMALIEKSDPKFRVAITGPAERFSLGPTNVASVQEQGRSRVRSLLTQRATDVDLDKVLGTAGCEFYLHGEVVTLDEPENLRILEKGLCSVVRGGKEVRVLRAGDFFGPDLAPGEQVVAKCGEVRVCRFTRDASAVVLTCLDSASVAKDAM